MIETLVSQKKVYCNCDNSHTLKESFNEIKGTRQMRSFSQFIASDNSLDWKGGSYEKNGKCGCPFVAGQKNIKNAPSPKNREKSNGVENHVTHECQKNICPPPPGQKNIKNARSPKNRDKTNGVENHVAHRIQKLSVAAQILFCY